MSRYHCTECDASPRELHDGRCGCGSGRVMDAIWLAEENARLRSLNAEYREALQWYVDNDDTNEGDEPLAGHGGYTWDELNAFWLEGRNRARALLARANGGGK